MHIVVDSLVSLSRTKPQPLRDGTRQGRPYPAKTVAIAQVWVENTTLPYRQVAEKTGVGPAMLCRWARQRGWVRPAGAGVGSGALAAGRAGPRRLIRLLALRAAAHAGRIGDALADAPVPEPRRIEAARDLARRAHAMAGRSSRRGDGRSQETGR